MVLGDIQAGQYLAVAAVVVATLLTLAYFSSLLVQVFSGGPAHTDELPAPMPLQARLCLGALCAAIVVLGLFSDRIVGILLNVTPPLNL
jgi:multicomponent Na+:H+ antiporter subunit D